jgi:hypothetical protein
MDIQKILFVIPGKIHGKRVASI